MSACTADPSTGSASLFVNPGPGEQAAEAIEFIEKAQESGIIETAEYAAAQDTAAREERISRIVQEQLQQEISAQQDLFSYYSSERLLRDFSTEYADWRNPIIRQAEQADQRAERMDALLLGQHADSLFEISSSPLIERINDIKNVLEIDIIPSTSALCKRQKQSLNCTP